MATATMIVSATLLRLGAVKSFLDDANTHRKKFSGTSHTLVQDMSDPADERTPHVSNYDREAQVF